MFGNAAEEKDLIERVEGILAGYEKQDEDKRRARRKGMDEAFKQGVATGETNIAGFGL